MNPTPDPACDEHEPPPRETPARAADRPGPRPWNSFAGTVPNGPRLACDPATAAWWARQDPMDRLMLVAAANDPRWWDRQRDQVEVHQRLRRLAGPAPVVALIQRCHQAICAPLPIVLALTPGEHAVLGRFCAGASAARVAHELGITDSTVQRRLRCAAGRLGVSEGVDAVGVYRLAGSAESPFATLTPVQALFVAHLVAGVHHPDALAAALGVASSRVTTISQDVRARLGVYSLGQLVALAYQCAPEPDTQHWWYLPPRWTPLLRARCDPAADPSWQAVQQLPAPMWRQLELIATRCPPHGGPSRRPATRAAAILARELSLGAYQARDAWHRLADALAVPAGEPEAAVALYHRATRSPGAPPYRDADEAAAPIVRRWRGLSPASYAVWQQLAAGNATELGIACALNISPQTVASHLCGLGGRHVSSDRQGSSDRLSLVTAYYRCHAYAQAHSLRVATRVST